MPACSACGSRGTVYSSDTSFSYVGGCAVCAGSACAPGRTPCPPYEGTTPIDWFFYRVYQSFCCVDPCYEPSWSPIADAALFVDAPRPVTHQRIAWDANLNMVFPDRSEYFWARADGKGRGPKPKTGATGVSRLRYNELNIYTEAATGAAGVIVEMPYRAVYPTAYDFASGFTDMTIGTKSVLLDSDFLVCGFQFRTTLPSGQSRRGLGTGHVSIEPSLLVAMIFSPDVSLQGQLSQWIPIGGDTSYQGSVLHYHTSVNRVLGRLYGRDPIVGTFEFSAWSFQDGLYTAPVPSGQVASSGETYASLGYGLRMFVCERMDLGFGASFAVTGRHWADQLYRTEFRWRF